MKESINCHYNPSVVNNKIVLQLSSFLQLNPSSISQKEDNKDNSNIVVENDYRLT